ncbi:MAG TPA: hypothetical protein VFE62_21270 [Gemmataceae bacterium]|nr:hypothetical protein [Gemmataceae bacterium]
MAKTSSVGDTYTRVADWIANKLATCDYDIAEGASHGVSQPKENLAEKRRSRYLLSPKPDDRRMV